MQQQTLKHPLALMCVAALEDMALLTQWERLIQPLEQAEFISIWSERQVAPGADRWRELQHHIETSDLVVLLLSADFFAHPDCSTLMEQALHRSAMSDVRVIPLLLRPVPWQESPVGMLTPWPSTGKPISLWSNQDEGWDACVQELRRLLGRRVSLALPSDRSLQQADPDWNRMLRRLRRSYKELLDQSLHGIAWMELGLSTRSDLVSNVTNLLFQLPDGGEQHLPLGTSIVDAFDEAEGELLILGAPGAGKSTLLLDLAHQLVSRAQSAELPLLPVILRLSSWTLQRSTLAEWMGEQLSRTYDVPWPLSEQWVTQGRLLPLLDGLDEMEEVARPACIAAINQYHRTHLAPLVVCSRYAEYEMAVKHERLALQSAVIVQPLSDEQIESYLQSAGPSFAGVRAALSEQHALWELATTPLMLSVLLLTYRNTSIEGIMKHNMDLEQQVWGDYVARQVREKGKSTRYSLQQTCSRLSWLAQQMRAHHQTTFYAEYLQPDWLLGTQQNTVTRLITLIPSLVIGVCVSLLIFIEVSTDPVFLLQMSIIGGFIGGCLSPSDADGFTGVGRRFQSRTAHHVQNTILLGVLLAASFGLYLDLTHEVWAWLRGGYILGLGSMLSAWAFQVRLNRLLRQQVSVPNTHRDGRDCPVTWINTMKSLHIWQAAAALGIGIGVSYMLIGGLSNGLIVGLNVSVIVVLVRTILDTSLRTFRFAERIHWTWNGLFRTNHLRTAVAVTATIIFVSGLRFGLSAEMLVERAFGPNRGLVVGLNYGLVVGLSNGLIFGLTYWLLLGLYKGMKQEHLEDQNRSQFNQGIRRSLHNGLLTSLISAVIITTTGVSSSVLISSLKFGVKVGRIAGLSIGLSFVPSARIDAELSKGLILLIAGMIVMWTLSGGLTILRHYVIRWLLARRQTFPFRAQAFLDDATSRILLQRVGGGYSFIHRRLQDYFADVAVSPSQNERKGEKS